jgi:hypothetical protein
LNRVIDPFDDVTIGRFFLTESAHTREENSR